MLTLVGVVDADLGLGGGDLRAAERTYQLLAPGRRPGRPRGPAGPGAAADLYARAAGDAGARRRDRDRFLEAEAGCAREAAGLPPFGRLAALIVSAPDAESADFAARALARAAPHLPGVEVLGPAPAPLAVLRGRHRRPLSGEGRARGQLQAILREWLARVRFAGSTRLQVDIDPYSFLSRTAAAEGASGGRRSRLRSSAAEPQKDSARNTPGQLGHVGEEHLERHHPDPGQGGRRSHSSRQSAPAASAAAAKASQAAE